LKGESIGLYAKKKKVHMNVCLIMHGYRERAVWIFRPNCIRFL